MDLSCQVGYSRFGVQLSVLLCRHVAQTAQHGHGCQLFVQLTLELSVLWGIRIYTQQSAAASYSALKTQRKHLHLWVNLQSSQRGAALVSGKSCAVEIDALPEVV